MSSQNWYNNLSGYMNRSWARAMVQILNTVIPYLAVFAAMVASRQLGWPYWITLLMSIPAALLLVRIFIFFHDCTHGSFLPSNTANRIVGFITGILTFTAFEVFRRSHLKHHATNGQLDHRGVGDVLTMTVEEYNASSRWKRLGYRLYRNPVVLFVLGPLYTFVILNRFQGLGGTAAERRSVLLTNLGMAVVAVGISLGFGFQTYLAVQMPVILIAGSMGIWLFYVQHQFDPGYWERDATWNRVDAALYGASYYKLPAVLRWFTGNIGVHHIHHLQPRIPNYMLYRAYRELPEARVPKPLTFWRSLASIRINLWSELNQRFMSFREAARLAPPPGPEPG